MLTRASARQHGGGLLAESSGDNGGDDDRDPHEDNERRGRKRSHAALLNQSPDFVLVETPPAPADPLDSITTRFRARRMGPLIPTRYGDEHLSPLIRSLIAAYVDNPALREGLLDKEDRWKYTQSPFLNEPWHPVKGLSCPVCGIYSNSSPETVDLRNWVGDKVFAM